MNEIDPKVAEDYFKQGNILVNEKKFAEAITAFTKAINTKPNDDRFYLQRGIARFEVGQKKEAIEDYNQTIELNPNNKKVYFRRGFIYKESGEKDLAIRDYTKDIELNPQDDFSYFRRGYILEECGRKEAALEDFIKALEINPANNTAQSRGDLLMSGFIETNNVTPQIQEALLRKGQILIKLEKTDEAIKSFTQIIKANQMHHEAYFMRGQMYQKNGKLNEAKIDVQEAFKLQPENKQYEQQKIEIECQCNQQQQILQQQEESIKLEQQLVEVQNNESQNIYFRSFYWFLLQSLLACQQMSTGIFNMYNNVITERQCQKTIQYINNKVQACSIMSAGPIYLSQSILKIIQQTIKLGYGDEGNQNLENKIFRLSSLVSIFSKTIEYEIKYAGLQMAQEVEKFKQVTFSQEIEKISNIEEKERIQLAKNPYRKLGIEHCLDFLVYFEHHYEEIKINKHLKLKQIILDALKKNHPQQRKRQVPQPEPEDNQAVSCLIQ